MSMELDVCTGCDGATHDCVPCTLCIEGGNETRLCHDCRMECECCQEIVCAEHRINRQCTRCARAGNVGEAWSGGFAENH